MAFLCSCSLGYGMSQESSVKRCEANIHLLKTTERQFALQDLNSFWSKFVARLEEILKKLKTAKDAKAIVELRKSCDNGFDAARFLLETFENQEIKPEQNESKKEQDNSKPKDPQQKDPKKSEVKKNDNTPAKTSTHANSHKS